MPAFAYHATMKVDRANVQVSHEVSLQVADEANLIMQMVGFEGTLEIQCDHPPPKKFKVCRCDECIGGCLCIARAV
jgi:hypothetical protein